MSLNKEGMKATLRDLLGRRHWYGLVQIHAHRILVAAPELSDVFRDHLKEREAMCRRELKEIEFMRDHFELASHAMTAARLKLKHGR